MAAERSALIAPTANAALSTALQSRLQRRQEVAGSFGRLESLAVRLGLVQNNTAPCFRSARIIVFAADHGLAVEDIGAGEPHSTATTVLALLAERLPLSAFARVHGLDLTVVDSGVADVLGRHPRLLARKIAHGTRDSRAGTAMSTAQAHAAMRAGMEIGRSLSSDLVACAGIGQGSAQSAELLLSCLSDVPLLHFADSRPGMAEALIAHRLRVLQDARSRHGHLEDAVDILAATGGFEVAMMVGLMLVAASQRQLIVVDGMAACAALLVAMTVAPALTDYCIHVRSSAHSGLDRALELFRERALIDIGLDSLDGTGATLAWPLVRCAAALLGEGGDAR